MFYHLSPANGLFVVCLGLFYDAVSNEIGAEMAYMEANKLNNQAAVSAARDARDDDQEKGEKEKGEKEKGEKEKGEKEKGEKEKVEKKDSTVEIPEAPADTEAGPGEMLLGSTRRTLHIQAVCVAFPWQYTDIVGGLSLNNKCL